jgi:hypothetical protein
LKGERAGIAAKLGETPDRALRLPAIGQDDGFGPMKARPLDTGVTKALRVGMRGADALRIREKSEPRRISPDREWLPSAFR